MPEELIEAKILEYGKLTQIYNDILYYEKYRQALRRLGSETLPSNFLKEFGPLSNMRLGPLEIVEYDSNLIKIKKVDAIVKIDERKGKPLYAIVDFNNGIKVYLAFEIAPPIVGIDVGIRHLFTIVAILGSNKLYKVKYVGDRKMVDIFSKYLGESQGVIYINEIRERAKKAVLEVVEFLEELKPKVIAIEDLRLYDEEKVGKGLRAIQEILESELFRRGMKVRRLDPKNTSRICSRCGYRNGEILGSIFVCPSCGYKADRDFNAAYNLALKCYYTC